MRTAVVILNWNTRAYLEKWLPGVVSSCQGLAKVVVADSGSTDGSLELLCDSFPGVKTIAIGKNLGFTGGYDFAIAELLKDEPALEYLVLMNSDIEVADGWLEPLQQWMDAHPDCAVCGPKLHAMTDSLPPQFEYAGAAGGLLDRYGFPFCRGRVPGKVDTDRGQYDAPAPLLWISGACLVTRADVWQRLNGLDERFFAHMEEIDYCWRAQLLGYSVALVPRSVVRHLGGGTLPQNSPHKLFLNYRNNLLLLDNNLRATYVARGLSERRASCKASRLIFIRMVLDGIAALAYLLTGKFSYFKAVFRAHSGYRSLKGRSSEYKAGSEVKGLTNVRIVLLTAIKGDKIFNSLTV